MRKALAFSLLTTAVVGGLVSASPAGATDVTFTLAAGSLSISQPTDTATLTGGALDVAGSTVGGALGQTAVSDSRGGVTGWSSNISGSALTNGTTTIPAGSVKAFVPAPVATTGTAVTSAGTYLTAATGLVLSGSAQPLVNATAVVGVNTATFTPNLSVAVPGNATSGTYTGAVTQTVS